MITKQHLIDMLSFGNACMQGQARPTAERVVCSRATIN